MDDGNSRNHDRVRRIAVAILLAGSAIPADAGTAAGSLGATEASQPAPEDRASQDIIVTGQYLFRDIQPERQLDEQGISSYGVSTVDELLGEIQSELGDEDDQPLILVNGERVNDIDEIGAYPIEALRSVQVLPRGTAVRAGGKSGQRVISMTMKRDLRSATVTVAPKIATDGGWHGLRGEALATYIKGSTRANLGFRARDDSWLLESERDIVQPEPRWPYSLGGNIVGYPLNGSEIDPLLSALAGEIVTVAPIPGIAGPSLGDFAAAANQADFTDIGDFRTLRPKQRTYDLNGSFSTRLAPWLTSTATLRLGRSISRSLRGLPGGLFVLSADNPYSPFSEAVGLALYGPDPLRYRSQRDNGELSVNFNARWGEWLANFDARHRESKDTSQTERQGSFAAITLDDLFNPFTSDLGEMVPVRTDRSSARGNSTRTQLSITGPAAKLPAGPLTATVEGRLEWNHLRSTSTFSATSDRDVRESEQSIRAGVDVPLTSIDSFFPQLGDLSATAEYTLIHSSFSGSLDGHALGLTWEPVKPLRLRGSIEQTEESPPVEILGSPVIVNPDSRIFDPLTGETVDVVQISGGNPDLRPQKTTVRRVTALLRLVPKLNLQLNAEYTDTDRRNFVSSLPSASAAVMLAFPDRYVRDSSGTLTTIDLRPVNFDSHREKRLRWGFSMSKTLGGRSASPAPARETISGDADQTAEIAAPMPSRPATRKPPTRFQLTANHSIVFSDKIVIRSGLDTVDLLGGGAIGIGGGRLRNQLDATASLNSGGDGVRIGVSWRGPSSLESRLGATTDTLHFSPVTVVNLRAFTDLKRVFPNSGLTKGLRLSLDVINLLNDRQDVRDSAGSVPLQYQPGYRDAIGRTIEFEIRKVF
jgi:hypothetical protein